MGESVEAIFDPAELEAAVAGRRSIPSDLMKLLQAWALGFCPLNTIERSLSDLIEGRGSDVVRRSEAAVSVEDAMPMVAPGDVLIDCTGCKSQLPDQLMSGSDGVDGITLGLERAYARSCLSVHASGRMIHRLSMRGKHAERGIR
jgi:Holliday junction resolvase